MSIIFCFFFYPSVLISCAKKFDLFIFIFSYLHPQYDADVFELLRARRAAEDLHLVDPRRLRISVRLHAHLACLHVHVAGTKRAAPTSSISQRPGRAAAPTSSISAKTLNTMRYQNETDSTDLEYQRKHDAIRMNRTVPMFSIRANRMHLEWNRQCHCSVSLRTWYK